MFLYIIDDDTLSFCFPFNQTPLNDNIILQDS